MFSLAGFLEVEKENRRLLLRSYYCFFCSGMMCTLVGGILPAVRAEYGISYACAGVLTSAQQAGNLLSIFAAGLLPYAIGRKKTSVGMGSGIFLGLLLLTLTGNPAALFVSYALMGVGRGILTNMTNVLVGQHAGNKAGGLNLLHAVFAVGAALSPFVAIAAGGSLWRLPCWIVAACSLLSMVLLGASSLQNKKESKPKQEPAIPKTADFWRVTMILFCYISAESSLMNWLVTYVKDTGIIAGVFAISVQSMLWITILAGRLACVWLASKLDKNALVLVLASMAAASFIILASTKSKLPTASAVLGLGLSMGGIYPTTLSTMPSRYAKSTLAIGICIGAASIGGIIMPLLVGLVANRTNNIRSGFVLITLSFVLLLIIAAAKLAAERERPSGGRRRAR